MEELSKELKALLYKRINTPFWVFYFISLIVCNYKFILFLISSDYKILEKIDIIEGLTANSYSFLPTIYSTIIIPIGVSLLYIIIFPFIERKALMPIWKRHKMKLKEDYAKLDKQEIITGEEKDIYLEEILNLRREKNNLVEELTKIDVVNETKINKVKEEMFKEYNQEKEKLNVDFEIKLRNEKNQMIEHYETILSNLNKNFEEKINQININNKEIEENQKIFLSQEIDALKEENSKILMDYEKLNNSLNGYRKRQVLLDKFNENKYKKYLNVYSKEEMIYFESIYKNNISDRITYNTYIDKLIECSNLQRNTLEYITDELIKKEFIKYSNGHIYFDLKLKRLIYEIFSSIDLDELNKQIF